MRASPLLSPAAAGQTKMPGEQTEPSAPRRAAPLSPLKVLNPEPARGGSGAVRSERAPLSGPYRAVPPSRARLRPPPPPPRPWRPISGRPRPGRVPPRPAARSGGAVKVLRSQRARIAAGRPAAPRRASPESRRRRLRAAATRVSRRPLRLVHKSMRGPQCTATGRRAARLPLRPRLWPRCSGSGPARFPALLTRVPEFESCFPARPSLPLQATLPPPTATRPKGGLPRLGGSALGREACSRNNGEDRSRCQRPEWPRHRSDGRSGVPSGARRVAARPCRAGLPAALQQSAGMAPESASRPASCPQSAPSPRPAVCDLHAFSEP